MIIEHTSCKNTQAKNSPKETQIFLEDQMQSFLPNIYEVPQQDADISSLYTKLKGDNRVMYKDIVSLQNYIQNGYIYPSYYDIIYSSAEPGHNYNL